MSPFGPGNEMNKTVRRMVGSRKRKTVFDKEQQNTGNRVNPDYLKEASDEEMAAVREKIRLQKAENRRRNAIILLVSALATLLFFWFVNYLMSSV